MRRGVITKLQKALTGQIFETVDCRNIDSLSEFSRVLRKRYERLTSQLGFRKRIAYRLRSHQFGMASEFKRAMEFFGEAGQQGYLILDRIDYAIDMQRTLEVEGPLRSVIKLDYNTALVLSGPNRTINTLVRDSRRPFYM